MASELWTKYTGKSRRTALPDAGSKGQHNVCNYEWVNRMNEEALEPTKELSDYLDTLHRRRKGITTVFTVLFLFSLVVIYLIPPSYRSSATILIQQQEIPRHLIRSTVNTYAWERIQTISQRVMTRPNLMRLINRFDLYPTKRRIDTTEELVKRMRDDIELKAITAKVIDPATGQPRPATIAFKLSYYGQSPTVAQKVDSELTTLYLNENIKSRTKQATNTFKFVSTQTQKLQAHINKLEGQIATFKEKHLHSLPDLEQLNLELLDRNENDLTDTANNLRSLQDRKTFLEGQLAQINPNIPVTNSEGLPVLDPKSKIEELETEYATKRAEFYPDYPDVVRLKQEIDGMKKQIGGVSDRRADIKELGALKSELAAKRAKFSDNYPDVVRLRTEIAALETQIRKEASEPDLPALKPQNPAYLEINADLQGVNTQIAAATKQPDEIKDTITQYETYIAQTPMVQREYRNLKRDYQNSQLLYTDLRTKEMAAKIGQQMEKDREGERLTLIDPPNLPQRVAKPNRIALAILSFFLSIGGGIAYAGTLESMDKSVHNPRRLAAILGEAPLSVIPYIENSADKARQRQAKRLKLTSLLVALIIAILLAQFLWIPWDVLWFKGMHFLSARL